MQPIDPDQWLKQYGAKIEQAKQQAEQAAGQLGGVGGSASSPDGLITVTVNATGVLTDLQIKPEARGMDPSEIATAVLAASTKAQREASGRVVQIMGDFVGESPALEFVKAQMPHGYAGDGTDEEEPKSELERKDTRPDDEYFTNPPDVMA
ncbi:YbaB/EbfC family nucleoid-associated protein [Lentzea sp. PSKA42]|jgi:DNA-binding protein YbaB|uniref:YbaB/EbfC family nucleoid-associated protein n=1 Tax=Lentzea indica TaxID=2604800 RepID=A0ABX1FBY3_9PSEU|nr:YbaB/EbfC family nucleoid-associated protein [Lentzea indica]NKE56410.1 YbaB/EbfC family nucleoid-associated protein [Lentzea indica]